MAVHFRPDSIMRDGPNGLWFHDKPDADDRMRRRWMSRWMDGQIPLRVAVQGIDLCRAGVVEKEARIQLECPLEGEVSEEQVESEKEE